MKSAAPLPLDVASGMEVVLVLAIALAASVLTLFSGFGLGTLLLPAFALVFPLPLAVAATAVVHLANNLWKAALLGRSADLAVVRRFGIPAAAGAVAGAVTLLLVGEHELLTYHLQGERAVTAIGLLVGLLIVVFALFDLVPALRDLAIDRRFLLPGGLLSGYFGGLSGHQGALRSIFLTKIGLDARAFVATGILCAILVDVGRLAVYGAGYARGAAGLEAADWALVAGAVAMAFLGAVAGARLLGKTTLPALRILIGVLLLLTGSAIAAGLV